MYRLMELPDGPKRLEYNESWVWGKFLQRVQIDTLKETEKDLKNRVVPVRAFNHVVLHDIAKELLKPTENLVASCEVVDYKMFVELKAAWFAKVLKVAGYRVLCQWIGHDPNNPASETFWIHMGSPQFQAVQYDPEENMLFYIPPETVGNRFRVGGSEDAFRENLKIAAKEVETMPTFNWISSAQKSQLPNICVFQVGQRLELLDYQNSFQVRPARVLDIIGRRICVQVIEYDCPPTLDTNDDKQYGNQLRFWVDQASFYLFHVGWAIYNGYQLYANDVYVAHSTKIATALKLGKEPEYDVIDVTRETIMSMKPAPTGHEHRWTANTIFELLDPLELKVRDLRPAKILEVLKDNYLKVIRIGSPLDEIIPLHSSSPYLFPIKYGHANHIKLISPEHEAGGSDRFSWYQFTSSREWTIIPDADLFKEDPSEERKALFKPGAKLEAADLCDNYQICPATIMSVKGRMLHLRFDGWSNEYDLHVDIDSPDIFPIGWCELMGCKLDWPNDEVEKLQDGGIMNREIKYE